MNEFQILIDKILKYFAGEDFKDELTLAKKSFFESTSFFDENTESFEVRMSQFYDWYFFSRDLGGYGRTPLEACTEIRELRYTEKELANIVVLRQHRHSLFEFIKNKGGDIYIRDLFNGKKLIVKKSPWVFGFDPEEYFEVRLFQIEDNYVFSKGFCFHPATAKKYLLSEIKRFKKDSDLDPEDLMLRLLKMRYKYDQYRHVAPELIYSNESVLKF